MAPVNILVVDDDFEDRFFIESAFNDLGLGGALHFADNGEKALGMLSHAIDNNEGLPTLVVLDLNMPRMTGTEVLKLLKANNNYRHIEVVIFSTALNEVEREECIKYGSTAYIVKPVTYSDFLTAAQSFYNMALAS